MNKLEITLSITIVVLSCLFGIAFLPNYLHKNTVKVERLDGLTGGSEEIDSISVSFQGHSAVMSLSGGSLQTTNSTLVNGDVVETTTFVPNGQVYNQRIGDPSFTQIFGSLMESNPPALNMDAVTNATIGQTGVNIAGFDTSAFDVTTNQEMQLKK